jgi:hypothetical protein
MDNFEIFYDQDKGQPEKQQSVIVLRGPRSGYGEIKNLLSKLLASFIYFGCSRGELFDSTNERVWADLRAVVPLLNLVGGGTLDLERIDDFQLLSIFFTDNPVELRGRVVEVEDEDGRKTFTPGKLCALYGFNFLDYHQSCRGIYGIALEMARQRMEEEESLELAKQVTATP